MAKPILYSYFRSSASWRVRIALAHKDISYDYKAVPLLENKQKTEEYMALNPMAQVPTLVVNGQTLTQSLAIIEYLEEAYPDKPLLPKDPLDRAKVRQIAEVINSGIQPLQNLSVITHIAELAGDKDVKFKWAKQYMEKGFKALEQILGKTAGKYSFGDSVTIADCCLVPQVYNAARFGVDMNSFPTIKRINEDLVKLDTFQAADPVAQPDCPEDLKKAK